MPGRHWFFAYYIELHSRNPVNLTKRIVLTGAKQKQARVLLLVLGDLGRSPRMQMHALALARHGVAVDLVGYGDSPVYADVASEAAVRVHCLASPVRSSKRAHRNLVNLFFIFDGLVRTLHQAAQILRVVLSGAKPRFVLVQNPPAIPTLAAVWLAASLRRRKWFIDWHNFADSVLALKLGRKHWIVRVAGCYERFFARRAHGHLCVSHAMRDVLKNVWGIDAGVVHDRPLRQPQAVPLHQQHMLLLRLQHCLSSMSCPENICETFKTRLAMDSAVARQALSSIMLDCAQLGSRPSEAPAAWADKASLHPQRSALLVSSSSWTADDDPGLILQACRLFEQHAASQGSNTNLVVLLTGQGPGRAAFERELEPVRFQRVQILTAWLHPCDYQLLLASADLGISLHRSSSGVDLPIKVIDMLGAGLPVATYEYHACVHEQIKAGYNALTFTNGAELGAILWRLFSEPAERWHELNKFKTGAMQGMELWDSVWTRHAAPLLLGPGQFH